MQLRFRKLMKSWLILWKQCQMKKMPNGRLLQLQCCNFLHIFSRNHRKKKHQILLDRIQLDRILLEQIQLDQLQIH
jgi:hypothetical protein